MKVLVWVVTMIGLIPAFALILCIAWALGPSRTELDRAHPIAGTDQNVHRVLVSQSILFGSWRVEWYPRIWAAIMLALGVLLVVAGLFVLLHLDGSNRLTW